MRPDPPAWGAVLAVALACAIAGSACAAPETAAPAAADSLPAPPADSLRAAGAGRARSARAPASEIRQGALPLDLPAERKAGIASLEDLLRMRRPTMVRPLPLFGPTVGSLDLPDGSGAIRLLLPGSEIERATDAPIVGSAAMGWGMPWLATWLDDPAAEAAEILDVDALVFPAERTTFHVAGEALVHPVPYGPAFPAERREPRPERSSRTTLFYRKGDGEALDTGARFQTVAWGRSFYASFARHQADGLAPLGEAVSERYALRADVVRALGHRVSIDGLLYERSITDSVSGESEWERRHVALTASRDGVGWSDTWRVGASRGKETWIASPDANLSPSFGSRERWEFPRFALDGALSWRPDSTTSLVAGLRAASRRIVFREDSVPSFDPRREGARVHLGARYAGKRAGAGIDGAYDVLETQPGLFDARASLWMSTERIRARVDVESAHERPSWVDLLAPPRAVTFLTVPDLPAVVVSTLFRSGNPDLKPRRLAGALGSLSLTPTKGVSVELTGSMRRVTDDFGWDLSVDTTGGSYAVSSVARARGEGWVSHAGCAWEIRRGFVRTRGAAWVRGGPDSLSPVAGSPPRRALDASIEARVVLFRGDLPLRFGAEAHARGPRRGLIRESSQVTWDGSLAADFGPAGAFLGVRNVFDRRTASAVWDPFIDSGAGLPGRTLHFGVVWNLLD